MATPLYYPALQWIKDKEKSMSDISRYFIRFGIDDISWRDTGCCIYLKQLYHEKEPSFHLDSIELSIDEKNLFTKDLETAKSLAIEKIQDKLLNDIETYQQTLEKIKAIT